MNAMRRSIVMMVLLSVFALAGCAGGAPQEAPPPPDETASLLTPTEVVQRFRVVLKAESIPTAMYMIDDIEYGTPAGEQVRMRIRKLADEMASRSYDFKPADAKSQDDCAVVIVRENPDRAGPATFIGMFLIRRDGAWRISPEPTRYEKIRRLSAAQASTFDQLDRWVQLRKADLKMESR